MTFITLLKLIPREALIWSVALIALAFYFPGDSHISLCPISNLGFDFCPGCGLGRSIAFALHGAFSKSFQAHPLGMFAVIILVYRIISLTQTHIQRYGKNT